MTLSAYQWRKRFQDGIASGDPYYIWSEWEPLVPPCMDARDLSISDPDNYQIRPLYTLDDQVIDYRKYQRYARIYFGYAPGQYTSKCVKCGIIHDWTDKRSSVCPKCADDEINLLELK